MKKDKQKKSRAGRKKLPAGEKREGITIYPKLSTIIEHGGRKKLRMELIKYLEGGEHE